MGRILLAKCAEAQALRRGWPEDLSGVYGEEELQRAEVEDLLAHERVVRATDEVRQRMLLGGRTVALSFTAGAPLEPVAREDIAQRIAAFLLTTGSAEEIESFQARNLDSLRTFWEWAPGDALDIKRQTERTLARLKGTLSHADSQTLNVNPRARAREAKPRIGARRRRQMSKTADQGDQGSAS